MASGRLRLGLPPINTAYLSLFIISVCCLVQVARLAVETHTFTAPLRCLGQVLNPSLRYHSQWARSTLECAMRCSTQSSCMSAEFDATNKLCHLSTQKAEADCSNMVAASGIQHFERMISIQCLNGGTDDGAGNCICTNLYCGPTCEQVVQDCQDLKNCKGLSLRPATVEYIWPSTSPSPFQVLCQGTTGENVRTYLAKRTLSTVDFNRTWNEYKNGFGDLVLEFENHWIGLDKLHFLTTNRAYELKLNFKLNNGSQYFGVYPNFVVANESNVYSFSTSAPSQANTAIVQDCLSQLEGAAFSTYDKDSDGSVSVNCAERLGGGFWYNGDNCTAGCSPLGPLLQPVDDARSVPGEAFFTINEHGQISPNSVLVYLVNL